jgi:hypothetical protein
MDQFIAAPIVLGGFFAFAGMLEGKSVDDVKKKVESVSRLAAKREWGRDYRDERWYKGSWVVVLVADVEDQLVRRLGWLGNDETAELIVVKRISPTGWSGCHSRPSTWWVTTWHSPAPKPGSDWYYHLPIRIIYHHRA